MIDNILSKLEQLDASISAIRDTTAAMQSAVAKTQTVSLQLSDTVRLVLDSAQRDLQQPTCGDFEIMENRITANMVRINKLKEQCMGTNERVDALEKLIAAITQKTDHDFKHVENLLAADKLCIDDLESKLAAHVEFLDSLMNKLVQRVSKLELKTLGGVRASPSSMRAYTEYQKWAVKQLKDETSDTIDLAVEKGIISAGDRDAIKPKEWVLPVAKKSKEKEFDTPELIELARDVQDADVMDLAVDRWRTIVEHAMKTPSNTPDTQPSGDERPDQDIQ